MRPPPPVGSFVASAEQEGLPTIGASMAWRRRIRAHIWMVELKLAPEPELGPKVAPEPEPEPADAVERLLGARPGAAWGRLRGRTPQLLSAWQVRPSFSHKSQHTIREGALFGAFLMVRGRRSSASPSTSTMRWHWCAATKPSNLAAHENG